MAKCTGHCSDQVSYVTCSFCHGRFTEKYYTFTHCRDYPSGGCASSGGVRLSAVSPDCDVQKVVVENPAAPAEPLLAPSFAAAPPHYPDPEAPLEGNPSITGYEHYLEEQDFQVAHASNNGEETKEQLIERFLATHLSGRQLQTLLNFFPPGHSWQPSTLSAKSLLTAARDAKYGIGFQHIDISDEVGCPGDDLVVSVRRDILQCFIDLVQHCNDTVTLVPEYLTDVYGQRVINEFWTGDRWLELQVRHSQRCSSFSAPQYFCHAACNGLYVYHTVQRALGDLYPLLFMFLWSDKVNLDDGGRHLGHPMTISCGEVESITVVLHYVVCWISQVCCDMQATPQWSISAVKAGKL